MAKTKKTAVPAPKAAGKPAKIVAIHGESVRLDNGRELTLPLDTTCKLVVGESYPA